MAAFDGSQFAIYGRQFVFSLEAGRSTSVALKPRCQWTAAEPPSTPWEFCKFMQPKGPRVCWTPVHRVVWTS